LISRKKEAPSQCQVRILYINTFLDSPSARATCERQLRVSCMPSSNNAMRHTIGCRWRYMLSGNICAAIERLRANVRMRFFPLSVRTQFDRTLDTKPRNTRGHSSKDTKGWFCLSPIVLLLLTQVFVNPLRAKASPTVARACRTRKFCRNCFSKFSSPLGVC